MSRQLRKQPTVVELDGREVISTNRWNEPLVADKMMREAINKWITLNEIVKFAYGQINKANKKRARGYLWSLRRGLLGRGHLLITDGRPTEALKIFDPAVEHERGIAGPLIAQMKRRRDFSMDLCNVADAIYSAEISSWQKRTATEDRPTA